MKRVIVPLSGGIDSSIVAAYLKDRNWQVLPLFINHHQGPLEAERQAANHITSSLRLPEPLEIEIDLESLKKINDSWLNLGIGTPARNMIFISIATMYAGIVEANAIALGSAYGSTYPDTSYAFLQLVEQTSRAVLDRHIRVFSPFKDEKWTSSEIVREGSKLGVPLEKTWSCYLPRTVQCGICIKCKRRIKRFERAKVKDNTLYSDDGVTNEQLKMALAFV